MDKPILDNPLTRWIVFFSQTGGEICDLSEKINRAPDAIITDNNQPHTYDERLSQYNVPRYIVDKPVKAVQYENILNRILSHAKNMQCGWLCTLHGWLNIVPKSICEKYPDAFYNGHPALISKYPELKGKDPQLKILEGNYNTIGSVVHKVTCKVDDGKILASSWGFNRCKTQDDVFKTCKEMSLIAWQEFWKLDLNKI